MNGIILTNTPNPDCDSTASNALAGLSPPHCMMHHDAELRLGRPRPPSVGLSCSSGLSSPLHDAERFGVADVDESGGRGELEITDVNNEYIRKGAMGYSVLDGYWSDAGTFGSLLRAGVMVEKEMGNKNEVQE